MGHGSAPSGSLDVVDIDRNEHIVAKRQVVLADPVDTALGRIDETVEFAGLERIVGARRASEHAHDLDAVIVAPQHPVWAALEGLLRRMDRDIGRKFDAQAAPDLARAVPRIDLLDLKPRAREEEGRGEIGPDRITAEIDDVLAVPRRRHLVIGEGGPGRRPFADKLAVVSHDRRAVGLVDTALPGGGAGSVFDMLMLRIDGEARIFKMPFPALERPDRAADRRPRLQRLYILPAIETAVRLQRQIQ